MGSWEARIPASQASESSYAGQKNPKLGTHWVLTMGHGRQIFDVLVKPLSPLFLMHVQCIGGLLSKPQNAFATKRLGRSHRTEMGQ
jgi:hypothetical protein